MTYMNTQLQRVFHARRVNELIDHLVADHFEPPVDDVSQIIGERKITPRMCSIFGEFQPHNPKVVATEDSTEAMLDLIQDCEDLGHKINILKIFVEKFEKSLETSHKKLPDIFSDDLAYTNFLTILPWMEL